jgi:hypothetical protein
MPITASKSLLLFTSDFKIRVLFSEQKVSSCPVLNVLNTARLASPVPVPGAAHTLSEWLQRRYLGNPILFPIPVKWQPGEDQHKPDPGFARRFQQR